MQNFRNETIFGYKECNLSVPDELKAKFSNFPPIFKKIEVSRNDIGEYMKTYAEENDLSKQPQRMLMSSFKLTNLTLSTFTWVLDYSVQKLIDLYNTHHVKYSTFLFTLLLMLGEPAMKIHYLVY